MRNKKKRKSVNQIAPRCPYCGAGTVLRSADGIYHDNEDNTMLYVCRNYPLCDAYVRVVTGTIRPVGTMANGALRHMRHEAHQIFDQLYNRKIMTRKEAYEWLSEITGIPLKKAHIGLMGEYYTQLVIEESKKLLSGYQNRNKESRKEKGENLNAVK